MHELIGNSYLLSSLQVSFCRRQDGGVPPSDSGLELQSKGNGIGMIVIISGFNWVVYLWAGNFLLVFLKTLNSGISHG
jgi:hypothetical protein